MKIAGEKVSKWSGLAAAFVLSLPILAYVGWFVQTAYEIGEFGLGYFIFGFLIAGMANLLWAIVLAAVGAVISAIWLAVRPRDILGD